MKKWRQHYETNVRRGRGQNLKRTNPLYKDVKEINILFLILIGVVLVGISGFSSYAYFTSEVTSPNEIRAVVKEPITIGTETLIKKVGTGGLVAESHPATTQMTATTAYRYIGKDPDNYIKFNNETWRIIGVFDTEDGTGKIEKRIKIIGNSIENLTWDTTNANDWSKATLKTLINEGDYYNRTGSYVLNGLTEEAKNKIADAKWYLGGAENYASSLNGLANYWYSYERGTTVYSGRPTSWIGKVGLMYPSDYGYATSGGATTNREACLAKELFNWSASAVSDCKNNDWLYDSNNYQWTLSPLCDYSNGVFRVSANGSVVNGSINYANAMRPSIYLKSDITLTGEGTSSSPYEIK